MENVRMLEEKVKELQKYIRNLQIAGTECLEMLEHYGPPAPDHVCSTPDSRCDCLCQEHAQFSERLHALGQLFNGDKMDAGRLKDQSFNALHELNKILSEFQESWDKYMQLEEVEVPIEKLGVWLKMHSLLGHITVLKS